MTKYQEEMLEEVSRREDEARREAMEDEREFIEKYYGSNSRYKSHDAIK